MLRTIALVTAASLAIILAAAWYFVGRTDAGFAQCGGSQVAGDIGGAFELVNGDGETVTDADVITEPTLIYFGYTFCPDVCPFDVARNADAVDLLAERGISVTPVFVSIDPARDTVEVVSDFADNIHPKMIGLTGSEAQVAQASRAYKTYYKAHEDGTDDYLVDHSTFTYLVLPEHGFVEFFRRDASAEEMAERTACFVRNS